MSDQDFTQADTDIEQLVEKHQEERTLMARARELGDHEAATRHHQAAIRAISEAYRLTRERSRAITRG